MRPETLKSSKLLEGDCKIPTEAKEGPQTSYWQNDLQRAKCGSRALEGQNQRTTLKIQNCAQSSCSFLEKIRVYELCNMERVCNAKYHAAEAAT